MVLFTMTTQKHGFWVIGIHQSKKHVRFIRVQNRSQETVKLVLNKYIQMGSHVWTDSFKSHNDCSMAGYVHQSVNHSQNFVDPDTGAHTQGIKRAWLDAKCWYKCFRGNKAYLQSHLKNAKWGSKCIGTADLIRTLVIGFNIQMENAVYTGLISCPRFIAISKYYVQNMKPNGDR